MPDVRLIRFTVTTATLNYHQLRSTQRSRNANTPSQVKRNLKIVTTQQVDTSKPPVQEGFPMRNWSVEIFMVNEADGSLMPATMYDKVTYNLHPSFGEKAKQGESDLL